MFNSNGDNFTDDNFKTSFARTSCINWRNLSGFIVATKAQDRLQKQHNSCACAQLSCCQISKYFSCSDNSHIGRKLETVFLAYCPPMSPKSHKKKKKKQQQQEKKKKKTVSLWIYWNAFSGILIRKVDTLYFYIGFLESSHAAFRFLISIYLLIVVFMKRTLIVSQINLINIKWIRPFKFVQLSTKFLSM